MTTGKMNEPIATLTSKVAHAVGFLKQTLERNQLDALESAIAQVQVSMNELGCFSGGVDALVLAIDQLPLDEGAKVRALLQKAKVDHEVCGQLIRLAQQRNAALQAYTAQHSAAATYSPEGGVSMVASGSLLGKF